MSSRPLAFDTDNLVKILLYFHCNEAKDIVRTMHFGLIDTVYQKVFQESCNFLADSVSELISLDCGLVVLVPQHVDFEKNTQLQISGTIFYLITKWVGLWLYHIPFLDFAVSIFGNNSQWKLFFHVYFFSNALPFLKV